MLIDKSHFISLILTLRASPPKADRPQTSIYCVIKAEA